MDKLDNIIHKLNMTGSYVMGRNKFGVLATTDGYDTVIYYMKNSGDIQRIREENSICRFNDNFIILNSQITGRINRVLTAYNEIDVSKCGFLHASASNIIFLLNEEQYSKDNTEVVLLYRPGLIYIINYLGKYIDISDIVGDRKSRFLVMKSDRSDDLKHTLVAYEPFSDIDILLYFNTALDKLVKNNE